MPYLGVYLSLVTLKGQRFYCCLCLRTEIKSRNKTSSCLRGDNLNPLLRLRYNVSVISRVCDFCVLRYYICTYGYGSSLIQHASAYLSSSVSHNKFHLLHSLLVSSHKNKSTKDNLKFHSQHNSTGSPTIVYFKLAQLSRRKGHNSCRLSGSLTGWISGLSVSWVAESRSEQDRRSITVKLSNKTKQFLPCT